MTTIEEFEARSVRGRLGICRGLTIAELIVVAAIMGILAATAIPVLKFSVRREKEFALRERLQAITMAIDRYHDLRRRGLVKAPSDLLQGNYPKTLEELEKPIELVDGRRLRLLRVGQLIDPFTGVPDWQTQSSTDDSDALSTNGANVFEIHSTSGAVSLDGHTRYSDW